MRIMTSEDYMTSRRSFAAIGFALILSACFVTGVAAQSQPSSKPAAPTAKPATSTAALGMAFESPQAAAAALIKAAGDYDVPQLLAILGPEGHDVVASKDEVGDKNRALAFAADAKVRNSISMDPSKPNQATLIVGANDWPLPVPIIKKNGKWYFDSTTGRRNILYRRIGANELDAITVCRGYVNAQLTYAMEVHDDSGINQYAQKIISTPGKQDGLYWKNADGTSAGPIGEPVAKAIAEGYTSGKDGYHGYYFKILKGQGPNAPLGKMNYIIEGVMIGGFALVAVPVEYRVTGVNTFIVDYNGVVYQKDLGPDSLEIVKKMELYNPDPSWRPTDAEWPEEEIGATSTP